MRSILTELKLMASVDMINSEDNEGGLILIEDLLIFHLFVSVSNLTEEIIVIITHASIFTIMNTKLKICDINVGNHIVFETRNKVSIFVFGSAVVCGDF